MRAFLWSMAKYAIGATVAWFVCRHLFGAPTWACSMGCVAYGVYIQEATK